MAELTSTEKWAITTLHNIFEEHPNMPEEGFNTRRFGEPLLPPVLKSLEKLGFVTRTKMMRENSEDMGKMHTKLTPAGEALSVTIQEEYNTPN